MRKRTKAVETKKFNILFLKKNVELNHFNIRFAANDVEL
jgi:hypothetical protein